MDKILNENQKQIDYSDLVLKIDNFEKRADVLFDGMEQLLDCETYPLDDDLSDYDVDVTQSPTLLSTLQLCLELLQADGAANLIEKRQKNKPTSYCSFIHDIEDYINKTGNILCIFCMCWPPFPIWGVLQPLISTQMHCKMIKTC